LESEEVTDLADVLGQSIASDVRSYGYEGHMAFSFLGGVAASRVLILSNGIPMNTRRDGVIDLSLIPMMPGDRVEVVKGPLSALYGSSAIGGVLNVIPSKKNGLSAHLGATDQMGMNVGARAIHNFGILGMRAAGSYLTNPGFRYNDDVSRYNGNAALWVSPIEALRIEADAGFTHRELGVPGPAPDTSDTAFVMPTFGDSLVTSLYDNQVDNLLTASLKTSFSPLQNLTTSLVLYAVQQDFTYNCKYQGYNSDFTTYTALETDDYSDTRLGGDLQITGTIAEFLTLAGGASVVQEKFEGAQIASDSATDVTLKDTTWEASDMQTGAWAEALVEAGIFTPSAAVRLDNSSQYGTFISPEAGLSVEVIPRTLYVSAAYGQAFRAPSFNDLYWPRDFFSGGDSTLVPEKGQSATLSVGVRPLDFLRFSLAGSWKLIKDMISWSPDSAGFWRPSNVDQVTILGAEFSTNWRIADGLFSGSLGVACNDAAETRTIVTYSDWMTGQTRTAEVTRQAAFIPPLILKGNLAIRAWSGGEIATAVAWTAERINYYPDYSPYPQIGVIEREIEPSLKLDASVSQKLFKLLILEAGVKNVLNDQTPAHFGNYDDLDYPTAPRRFYGSVSVTY
ncbi:MAG: TonB-dependent receptor, partial [candidate division WOR-3 bacterium]|nr:TonB-dependent receptor [candidate division WOR-3 bacterium]